MSDTIPDYLKTVNYLQNIHFAKIFYDDKEGIGFTNQIFALVSSVIKSLMIKKKAIAFDYFVLDFKNNGKAYISDIIDIKKTNEYLKEKYNIVLLDKNTMKFKLHKAYYGVIGNMFDITNDISQYISKKDNSLFIPKNIAFNKIKGDPLSNFIKQFCFYYSLDDYNFVDNYSEILTNDIMSNPPTYLCKIDFEPSMCFIKFMPDIFNDILKNIKFTNNVIPSNDIINNNIFNVYNKINVLHLRVEDDALRHWGKQNNMSIEDFKVNLESKYIGLIQKYIQKDELTVILTYSLESPVIDFLTNNNYIFFHIKKPININQREIWAIHDLFLSTKCNNVFIGNFSMKNYKGSSFSYYILQKLEYPHVKKVLIDLDNIRQPEDVFY